MKCISITQCGKKCSRNAVSGEYRCSQHHKIEYRDVLGGDSKEVTEEIRNNDFKLALNERSIYDIFRYSHAHFVNLNTNYYKQKFLDIAVNNKHIFDDSVISELQNCTFSTEMFDIVKMPLLTWHKKQSELNNDKFSQIMYLTCMLDILKICIYLCIQKKKNSTWDFIGIYKKAEKELKKFKDEWREENINKLRIKEVSKSGVMCDDVFKYVFLNYM